VKDFNRILSCFHFCFFNRIHLGESGWLDLWSPIANVGLPLWTKGLCGFPRDVGQGFPSLCQKRMLWLSRHYSVVGVSFVITGDTTRPLLRCSDLREHTQLRIPYRFWAIRTTESTANWWVAHCQFAVATTLLFRLLNGTVYIQELGLALYRKVLLENLKQLRKKKPTVTESDFPLLRSHQTASGIYNEPNQPGPYCPSFFQDIMANVNAFKCAF
jgi:hypothetical protein